MLLKSPWIILINGILFALCGIPCIVRFSSLVNTHKHTQFFTNITGSLDSANHDDNVKRERQI